MTDPRKDGLKAGKGFPAAWLAHVDELLALPGPSRQYALVIFAFNLNWFFVIDPPFAEKTFLSVLETDSTTSADNEAVWAGFMWGARTPHRELYVRLKPLLLDKARQRQSQRRRHGEILSGILLAGWGSKGKDGKRLISNDEMRGVLLDSDDDFRSHTLWQLDRWSHDEKSNWPADLLTFLRDVWPKQKQARTPKISARLCDLALGQKEKYPEVAEAVTALVSKIESEHVFLPALHNEEGSKALEFPRHTLNLLYAVLPDDAWRWPYGAGALLNELEKVDPAIAKDPKFTDLQYRLNQL